MRKTRVQIIAPPYVQIPGLFSQKPAFPPLGQAYLASYVRERFAGEAEIDLLDAYTLDLSDEAVMRRIRDFRPDVLAMSATTLAANKIKRYFTQVRLELPDCVTVTGGPHASANPEDMAPWCDFVARGEGEITFGDLIEARGDLDAMRRVPGLAWMEDGALQSSEPRPYLQNLDELPFPAWDLLPMQAYQNLFPYHTRNNRFCSMFTSRGCPWSCDFCQKDAVWANLVRFRSLDNTFEEIHELAGRWDVGFIFFYDDTFTIKKKRLETICSRIDGENIPIKWSCLTRADCLTEEMTAMMAKSRCVEIQIGIESGDQEVLDSINKKMQVDCLREAFGWLKKYGIVQKGFLIFGHLHDTLASMNRTLDLALEIDPTWVIFTSFVPFPGTRIYETYKEEKLLDSYDWSEYNYFSKSIVHTEHYTAAELDKIKSRAYCRFYLRPKKLLELARYTIRSGGYKRMFRNALAFLDIINPFIRRNKYSKSVAFEPAQLEPAARSDAREAPARAG